MKRKPQINIRCFALALAFLLTIIQHSVYSQGVSHVVQGSVTGEKGEALQGVVVEVRGTSTKTITDASGKFSITIKTKSAELKFSYTGYADKTVSATDATNNLSVSLSLDTKSIEDVVVVGYNIVKKKDVTGSVSSVSSKDIQSRPVANAIEAMQGKVPGVDISTNERPGQAGSITIHGVRSLGGSSGNLGTSNAPLYVVDGIALTAGGIDNINPQDIESIDVLKDASATAIYGSRGANGVIIVTTKQGKSGKITLNLNSSLKIDNLVDNEQMMNSSDYITFKRWAYYYANPTTVPRGDQPTIANDKVLFAATADPTAWSNISKGWATGTWDGSQVSTTDWRGMVMQQNLTSDNTISLSGGTDKIKAYGSFGYLNNTGTIKGQSYKRYSAKSSIDITANKWFSFGNNLNITYSIQEFGQSTRNVSTIGNPAGGLYESARSIYPYALPYDSLGNRILFPGGDAAVRNIVGEWDLNRDQRVTLRAFASLYAQLNIGELIPVLKGLRYRINFGPDFSYYRNGDYIDGNSVANGGSTSQASLINNKTFSYTLDNLLYYDKTIGKHSFGITLLQTATAYTLEENTVLGNGIPYSSQLWNNLSSGVITGQFTNSSNITQYQLLSYMARLNYSYKDKYLLTASIRQDGSSVLPVGNKYAAYPSLALAWRVSKEKFMDNIKWVDDLKLRVGVGTTGNSAITPYLNQGPVIQLFYPFISSNAAGNIPNPNLANQDLKWESTTQYNLAFDFSLFKRRVSGSIDVYTSNTFDLIQKANIPSVTGYQTTFVNAGKTANNGVDITVTTVNIKQKDLIWTTTVNAAWQKEHIVALNGGLQQDINNGWFVGQPVGVIYGYKSLGLWAAGDSATYKTFNTNGGSKFGPGSVRVADLNGDNKIDANYDQQIIGWTRPRWVVGMTNTVSYKGWELSIFLYGRLNYYYNTGGEVEAARSVQRQINYYNENNTVGAEYQKPIFNSGGAGQDPYYTALGYSKASFIKVRNISLGKVVNNKFFASKGISNLKSIRTGFQSGYVVF